MDDLKRNFKLLGTNVRDKPKKKNNKVIVINIEYFEPDDKVKWNKSKYPNSYRIDELLDILTVEKFYINEKANVPVVYFKEYPNQPFTSHHFTKIIKHE